MSKKQLYQIPVAVMPQDVPADADCDHPSLYFNQELGWIDFNWRVLHLALDERLPLLERVRFVAITAGNLDEFIQKRVGALKRLEAADVHKLSPDGRTPIAQLHLLREAIHLMHHTLTATWEQTLKPLLREHLNIVICDYDSLTPTQQESLHRYFQTQLYPILTPLAVDPGRPFPFISNLSLSLAVMIRDPLEGKTQFARIKAPPHLGRLISLQDINAHNPQDPNHLRFLPIEQLIIRHIDELFPGMEILGASLFRIIRNADVSRDEEVAEDLLSMISEELRERRFAPVVMLEVASDMPVYDRELLLRDLELLPEDVVEVDGLLDLTACFAIANLNLPQQQFEPWQPVIPLPFQQGGKGKKKGKGKGKEKGDGKDGRSIFSIIRQGDLLVHHPYESFTATVQRLIEEAAVDPKVIAIKQTLYRTSAESPIVRALVQAAEAGKQVAVLIEVKARFDEANNIEWGQRMLEAGIHVAYGLVGLKTHTKATLIVRKEKEGIRTYCHIGTGNYNPKTANLYTDLGLLTCNEALGRDIVNLFHHLTGYAPKQPYEKVLVAPRDMRKKFEGLIAQEIEQQREWGNGRIIAKMNAIDDIKIISQLYRASQAGVQIDLIVRGHSRLRPGIPGFSDNIRVISILGRFLEHDRIFYFHNNGRPLIFIGSADWRGRNLNDRVELIAPVADPALQAQLIEMLNLALQDNYLAWDMHADGRYTLRHPAEGEKVRNFHATLMKQAKKRAKSG